MSDELKQAAKVQLVCERVGDKASKLPFTDNYFDVVCHLNCMQFWPDLAYGLEECFRVLKPGGRILCGSKLHGLDEFFGE